MSHKVLALTAQTNDMYRNTAHIAILIDSDAVLQTVKSRLLLHYSEWFLDLSAGIPWFTELLTHNPDFSLIESRVAETIIDTDGVTDLINLAMTFRGSQRELYIDFSYMDIYGTTRTETQRVAI